MAIDCCFKYDHKHVQYADDFLGLSPSMMLSAETRSVMMAAFELFVEYIMQRVVSIFHSSCTVFLLMIHFVGLRL